MPAIDLFTRVRLGRAAAGGFDAHTDVVVGASATWRNRARGEQETRWAYAALPDPLAREVGGFAPAAEWGIAGQTVPGEPPEPSGGQEARRTRQASPAAGERNRGDEP